MDNWKELDWFNSGEAQVIEEKLDDLDHSGASYCPDRSKLLAALDATPYESVRVAVVGQDPYPNNKFATGIAFSIPSNLRKYPPTLEFIYKELLSDMHVERKTGDLTAWCKQGVLLWNAIPTCLAWKSLSHESWTEWTYLTKEIIEKLSDKGVVFALLGRVARSYRKLIKDEGNVVIETSHPSPRGNLNSNNPFTGSRLFSTINAGLVELGYEHIDWK